MSRYQYNEKAYFEMVHKYESKISKLKKQLREQTTNEEKESRGASTSHPEVPPTYR